MRLGVIISSVVIALFLGARSAPAHETPLPDPGDQVLSEARTIYLDTQTKTWRPKKRVSFPLAAVIKMKLKEAGFAVVEDPQEPHDLLLKVDYREEQGEEYRIDLHGTVITAMVDLEHARIGSLLHLTIRASTVYPESGSRPYVNAVEHFETNPYFYFLGALIKARVGSHQDVTATLIDSLERMPEQEGSADDHALMLPSETLHVTWAKEHTIRELGRLKDPRAVSVLSRLLDHRNSHLRLVSVKALGEIGSDQARAVIERASRQDQDREVRETAGSILASQVPPP